MEILDLFTKIQKACLPGIWSKGVSLSRTGAVIQDSQTEDEIVLRVRSPDHPVSRKVSLWPEDEDWYCDCDFQQPVCCHVAAAIITLKTLPDQVGKVEFPKPKAICLSYRFTRKSGYLHFERWLVHPDGREQILTQSLVSFVGGIQSGRISSAPVSATREDYGVDAALLDENLKTPLTGSAMLRLMKALSGCSNITLDGQSITVSSKIFERSISVTDEKSGFRLQFREDPSLTEVFKNGAVLCGTVLRGASESRLSPEEYQLVSGAGTYFDKNDVALLVTKVIPELQKKAPFLVETTKLPKAKQVPPRIILEMNEIPGTQVLHVVPKLVYGTKSEPNEIILPDPVAEKALIRKLQSELQLNPGQSVRFEGVSAVNFVSKVVDWEAMGSGLTAFARHESLTPSFQFQGDQFDVSFETKSTHQKVTFQQIFQAWRENQDFVPLLGGGWAPLPKDWLARYGERIQNLLRARELNEKIPSFQIPEIVSLCEDLDQSYPETFKKLKTLLENVEKIDEAKVSQSLKETLRPYQKVGVNWLHFLRKSKMGAMLADDMGLGKSLQALCSIQGRTLIICPTSVLFGWTQQIERFRPELTYSVYHGAQRKLNPKADLTLITYAILRLDRELVSDQKWDTIILDEAQTIKNPESQISKSVHSLRADFKMALSGTPIENRLNDLWSQFQFLNPGLLGSLEDFQDQFGTAISRGDQDALNRLRMRVKPFILRRLKQEVAPELPPRTEIVLTCELDSTERNVYDAILAATRQEVVEKLEHGGNVIAALELLLRLRQACCHSGLVPGQESTRSAQSSKVNLLIESLEKSIALGHRALVFSQWTGYLDLIEPHLTSAGITYSRLDGSTKNREEIVNQFQNHKSPSVMLISLKAGGVGLTLTAADHIYLMDPWWNPAVENQAADRAHRIGQKNPVFIHRLVAEDTIEERIMNLQKTKSELASAVLEGAGSAASISREDIIALLS